MTTMANGIPDLIPVRMLAQYAYCKRLSYMEWVQGEFAYNADVIDGTYKHRNVDKPSGGKKMGQETDERIHAKSVMLSDSKLGIISKIDMLELEGGFAVPVEYKRGKTPENPEKSYEEHRIQVCAQGLLLRANGYECTKGMIYYVSSKQRIDVPFDKEIAEKTVLMIKEMREMAAAGTMPPPLIDSPKCPGCSLVGICLPDETNMLSDAIQKIDPDTVRRMYPVRNDSIPVHIQEQGAYVSKSGDCIIIKSKDGRTKKIRLIDISEIAIYGYVQISTQAIREFCKRNIPICYMTYGGWFTGMTSGLSHKNVELRMSQHRIHQSKNDRMRIARKIVFGKIKNCSTMLRRNGKETSEGKIMELERLAARAENTKQYEVLLGIEGIAARVYFSEFNSMIKTEYSEFEFNGRNRRPPRDPINAILSFLYAILVRQATITVSTVGFDPHLGFLHMPKYGKPSLALDIMEEFRPIVADSACITAINTGEITDKDVIMTKFGVNLTDSGRKAVITAYERRMNTSVTHPLLGYAASYKRIMETQARLLARHILGEIPEYPPFRTR